MLDHVARFVGSTFQGRIVEQTATNAMRAAFGVEGQETDLGYRESDYSVLEPPGLLSNFDAADKFRQFLGHGPVHVYGRQIVTAELTMNVLAML